MYKKHSTIFKFILVLILLLILPTNLQAKQNSTVKSISFTKPPIQSLVLKVKERYRIKTNVLPANATNKKLKFSIKNKSIATISKTGVITARRTGKTQILVVSSANKKVKIPLMLQVVKNLKKVKVVKVTSIPKTLYINGNYGTAFHTIKAKVLPQNATNKKLTYVSSNSNIVKVSSKGVLQAKKLGTVNITVYAFDGRGAKKTFSIRVKDGKKVTPSPSPIATSTPTGSPIGKPEPTASSYPTDKPEPTATPYPTNKPSIPDYEVDLSTHYRYDEGVTKEVLSDGSIEVSFDKRTDFQGIVFALQEGMDFSKYGVLKIDATISEQFGVRIYDENYISDVSAKPYFEKYPAYEIITPTRRVFSFNLSETSWSSTQFLRIFTLKTIGDVSASNSPITIHSIRFIPDPNKANGINIPLTADMNYARLSGSTTITNLTNGGVKIDFPGIYYDAVFSLPEIYDLSNYSGMIVECALQPTTDGALGALTFGIATSSASTADLNSSRAGGIEYYQTYTNDGNKTFSISFSCLPNERTSIPYFFVKSNSTNVSSLVIRSIIFIPNEYTQEELVRNLADASTGESLKDSFGKLGILIGAAFGENNVQLESMVDMIKHQYSSMTYENDLKPSYILVQEDSQKDPNGYPCINEEKLNQLLTFAKSNNLPVRGHTLVWNSQTPTWFFCEDYDSSKGYVTKEVMKERLEHYIKRLVTYCETNFPGVIYAWDVVNEAVSDGGGYWTNGIWPEVYGDESYVIDAFRFARRYTEGTDIKLFYNDYNTYSAAKRTTILELITDLKAEGLIDGLGMQSHVNIYSTVPSLSSWEEAIRLYGATGLEIHLTELDVHNTDNSESGLHDLADRYEALIQTVLTLKKQGKANVTNITFWGLSDADTWLTAQNGETSYPLLFGRGYEKKEAYHRLIALADHF